MENKNKLYIWIIIGVIAAAVVIYLIVTGGIKLPGVVEEEGPAPIITPQGVVAVPGASPVSDEGKVIAPTGQVAKNNVEPGTPEAPQQSEVITPKEVPKEAIKIIISASGFSPPSFTVKAGEAVTLVLGIGDAQTHIFKFDDPSLSAVATGVGPGDPMRAITFNAPTAPGEYAFHCDVPGHAARGEVGKMIVK